jgi:hypothetical protein
MDYEKLWKNLKLELCWQSQNNVSLISPVTVTSIMSLMEREEGKDPVTSTLPDGSVINYGL